MARLIFEEDFTLEVGEETYTATFRDLTKAEQKEQKVKKKAFLKKIDDADKLSKKILNLKTKLNIKRELKQWETVEKFIDDIADTELKLEKINKEIEEADYNEDIFKERLEISIMGEDKKAILDLGKTYSYQAIFETIQKDIAEKKN